VSPLGWNKTLLQNENSAAWTLPSGRVRPPDPPHGARTPSGASAAGRGFSEPTIQLAKKTYWILSFIFIALRNASDGKTIGVCQFLV